MSKFKLFIVEDDQEALKRLIGLLNPYKNIVDLEAIVIARSFAEAQNCITQTKGFDISILDKNLDEGETCFSLITEKNIQKFGLRVFNTIEFSDQELLKKLKISSGHLVLGKPYTEKSVSALMSEISEIALIKTGNEGKSMYIPIKVKSDYKFLRKECILAIVITKNMATIHYEEDNGGIKSYTDTGQMNKYLPELGSESFLEIRQGTAINIKYIVKINKHDRALYIKGISAPFTVTDNYIDALKQRELWP